MTLVGEIFLVLSAMVCAFSLIDISKALRQIAEALAKTEEKESL